MDAARRQLDAAGETPGPDEAALAAWMAANVAGFTGPLKASRFPGGQSNPTFRIDTPERRYVLRRQPAGQLLKGAHAVDREARVMTALETVGYPVPHVHALCTDPTVIGSWFYVMELVEGRIFWDGTFGEVPLAERKLYLLAMNRELVKLHRIDPGSIGLADYGRDGGYFMRQVSLWTRQYRADPEAGVLEDMDLLAEWLARNVPPESATRIIHGDYRCDNVIFHPTEPRVVAVLDWELSTLGDPLADFANHLMMYHVSSTVHWGLADRDPPRLGLPAEDEYIAIYCRDTGVAVLPDLKPYLVLSMFRFAAIAHGIVGRLRRGNAASAGAGAAADKLVQFAALGRELALSC